LARKANFWLPRALTPLGEGFRFRAKEIKGSKQTHKLQAEEDR
jgi:hypothetical protein